MPDFVDSQSDSADELIALRQRMEVLALVLRESTDPIFNILEDGTYQFVNQAFSRAFQREPEDIIGKKIWDIFSAEEAEKRMTAVRKAFATRQAVVFEVRVPTPTGDSFYLTSVKPILEEGGGVSSVVCISKNITDRKCVELEREKLIESLQAALLQVRTLSGLLPICAHCKKIRDDDGYWTQIECYIRDHSQAEFTHGICPDCKEVFFPAAHLKNLHD